MINKKEFDLLLKEISQIENKIVEVKILNQFDKANEYENALESIKLKAKDIVLDNENNNNGLDSIALAVLSELILLHSDIDYYILKTNNIIESSSENKIDAEALEKIKNLWSTLEEHIKFCNELNHNPIEEIEYNKHIGNITLEIIIYQLQIEGIIDFKKVFRYCKKDFLVNAIKKTLFEGAKDEFHDEIRRRRLIDLAKNIYEKDLYDYKLWQQILMIKNVRSRDDHIEILGGLQEMESKKYIIEESYRTQNNKSISVSNNEQNLEILYDESILQSIKRWFANLHESANQRKMELMWATNKGPAFKSEFQNEDETKYSREFLDKSTVENVKKLIVASNGISKYNFEKDCKWNNLQEIEFLEEKNASSINLSPDKTYNCIGNDSFADCAKLTKISFGKIEMIGERAFKNCTNISSVTFSKSLMNIGEDAFLGCNNLTKATFLGDLKLYILDRPQNVINCFRGTNLQEIIFSNIESAFNFAIADCPHLKSILISDIDGISMPFKTCKYRLGRQEGIVSFVGEKALNLWKKRSSTIRFFELEDDDK